MPVMASHHFPNSLAAWDIVMILLLPGYQKVVGILQMIWIEIEDGGWRWRMEVEDRIEDGFWILVELATWKLILSG